MLSAGAAEARIETESGKQGTIGLKSLAWARKALKDQRVSEAPKKAFDVLAKGDVIYVEEAKTARLSCGRCRTSRGRWW